MGILLAISLLLFAVFLVPIAWRVSDFSDGIGIFRLWVSWLGVSLLIVAVLIAWLLYVSFSP